MTSHGSSERASEKTQLQRSTRRRKRALPSDGGASPPADEQQARSRMRTTADDDATHRPSVPGDAESPEDLRVLDEATIAWYKTWKKAGSVRHSTCYKCKQPGGQLNLCETCPRPYHLACEPSGSRFLIQGGVRVWYCGGCVGFGWHVAPPALTPPSSPPPEKAVEPAADTGLQGEALPGEALSPAAPNEPQQHGGQFTAALSSAAATPHTDASSPSTATAAAVTAQPQPQPQPPRTRLPVLADHRGGGGGGGRGGEAAAAAATSPSAPSSEPKTRNRKSRFTTLSRDVDSALRVLYAEVESVPVLQKRVAELEEETLRQRQVLQMQQNDMASFQAMSLRACDLDAELQRLRTELSTRTDEAIEVASLRTKNKELEAEVADLRHQLEAARKRLDEWKHMLSSMITT